MDTIRVYSWKPANSSNFGDEIGPMIVQGLCDWFGVNAEVISTIAPTPAKLLAVGSVLHEAKGNDVIWGAGVNSKNRLTFPKDTKLKFRAVRGPLTRSAVLDQGFSCPPVYGDPGLLFPMLFDKQIRQRRSELEAAAAELGMQMPETIIIPNINDDRFLPEYNAPISDDGLMIVRPNLDPFTVAAYISAASRVISSSLHGLVFADVYGRSTTRLISQYEPEFKYADYYLGTGRQVPMAYSNVQNALAGDEIARLDWDPAPLLDAFPVNPKNMCDALFIKVFRLKVGKTLQVVNIDADTTPFGSGWSEPDDGSIWTVDNWAHLRFCVKEDISFGAVLRMNAGTMKKGKGSYERLRVVHEGSVISSHKFERDEPAKLIEIPLPNPGPGGEINLSFKLENPSSPKQYSDSIDERELGIWTSQLEIIQNLSEVQS